MLDPTFATVHDLSLSEEEVKVWGGLPTTPETYPCVDGMTPRDTALAHMVIVCLDRRDHEGARRWAARMTNQNMREERLALIALAEGTGG
jgi:hypothetical protein